MFKKKTSEIHKRKINERSKNWGQTKFKPNAFRSNFRSNLPDPVPEEAAQPWNHVKHDILDDEHEQRNVDRFDMNSQQAQEFRKQREQNHRRNIIETNRNAKTTWASFDDDDAAAGSTKSKKRKQPYNKPSIVPDPQNMTFEQQNYIRRKLTKAVLTEKTTSLGSAIKDMKRSQRWMKTKDDKKPINKNNKFRNN